MIILDSQCKSLEFVLANPATTNQMEWTSSWQDITTNCPGTTTQLQTSIYGSADGLSDDTNFVTLVAGPPQTANVTQQIQRFVQFVSIVNTDTVTNQVSVYIVDNCVSPSKRRLVFQASIAPGIQVYYNSQDNFRVFNDQGQQTVVTTGTSGFSGTSGYSGANPGASGYSGTSGFSGYTGVSGFSGTANAWSLTGNAGTTPGPNFVGTTDSASLAFAINSIGAGLLDTNVTIFGYNASAGNNSVSMGVGANQNAGLGTNNTAIGFDALNSDTSGGNNVAIGYEALKTNTTGSNNVAIGSQSFNSTNTNSVGIGFQTAIGGSNDVAVGSTTNTNGDSVAIGFEATSTFEGVSIGTGASGTNNGSTLIGYNSVGYANFSTAFGYNASTSGTSGSLALGASTNAKYTGSIAIGQSATTTKVNQLVLGADNIVEIKTSGNLLGKQASTTLTPLGTGAGTGAASTLSHTDLGGVFTVNTGTGPVGSNAIIATITISNSFNGSPFFVTFSPGDPNSAALNGSTQVYFTSTSNNVFEIRSGSSALTNGTPYTWYYHITGY